ncbi:uncharacterized protein LOC129906898 isoform X1 [Episyrphus balteatus]|uniref:uncharacterized protein LOC129906898 isoform X1 n=1 Tax=Episyrphus balteatus TaxID=286459 RepID=UPI00248624BE|nr:uncharacterized protein LOC129906898 isoform X1 [Episyrphus balteatus]XP_055838867.1 uncharacterized protein LOC129906898 isoform X1 [Episyrphus balteatus]XP_055838868.1 uncharacterized protein LOC129906898 isoform X1 [Episyrphus balteatus]XP_055838869.1 uncharacterized protein LOC129906898 isoform X1 [Episyrphus balteatus]
MRSCSIQVKTDPTHRKKSHNLFEKEKLILEKVSQRPTTLKLKPNTEFHLIQVKKNNLSNQHLSKNKTSNGLVSSSLSPTERKNGSCINNSTKIQSPTINSDLGKSEIFVNVSLSPSSHRSRIGGTQRHQAEIIVHPKVPFTRNFELATSSNHKSYTSLNLVLRQPSSNPQSLIDITVGPNLTYSSSSYHAPLGYQNNYQISFTNDFGVFSAFRISPFSNNGTNVATVDTGACEDTLDANSQDYYNIVKSTNACGKSDDWYDSEIKSLKNRRNKLWSTYKLSPTEINFKLYCESRDNFNRKSSLKYLNYIQKVQRDLKMNPKCFWNFINSKRKSCSYPSVLKLNDITSHDPRVITQLFSDFFQSAFNCDTPICDTSNCCGERHITR